MKHILALVLAILTLTACSTDTPPTHPTTDPTNPTTAEPSRDICSDYIDHLTERYGFTPSRDEVAIERTIGIFSGWPVLFMACPLAVTTAHRPVEVAGYTIVFPDGQLLYVYHDGEFLTLSEAYDAGLITASDLEKIGPMVGLEFTEHNSPHPNDDPTAYRYTAYLLRRDYAAQFGVAIDEVWVARLYDETYADHTAILVEMGRADRAEPEPYLVTVQDVHQFHTLVEAATILTPDEYAAVEKRLGEDPA